MKKILTMILAMMMIFMLANVYAEDATYRMAGYDGDNANHDWKTNVFFQRMQEKTGIAFDFEQYSDLNKWTERKATMADGKDLPDILFKAEMNDSEIRNLYEKGVLIDLRPYLAEYAPNLSAILAQHPEYVKAISLPDGAIVALPNFNELQNNNVMWINQSWMDKLGVSEMPSNVEELTALLRRFRDEDPNGNGRADEYPLTVLGTWDLRFLSHAFGIITNDYYVTTDENGTVSCPLTTDEYRAFVTWLHQLWDEKLLAHSTFSTSDSMRQVTDEKATILYGMFLSSTPVTLITGENANQYAALTPLTYNGKQIYRDLLGNVANGTFAITSACKNPEKLVAWVDLFYSEEISRLAQYGEENSEYFFNEKGYWEWKASLTDVLYNVMPTYTIAEGGVIPGYSSIEMQLLYDDNSTRGMITMINDFKQKAQLPVPQVMLTEETEKAMNALQAEIGPYVETTIACFVNGDLELNDDNWNAFATRLQELHMDEMVSLWQKAIQ